MYANAALESEIPRSLQVPEYTLEFNEWAMTLSCNERSMNLSRRKLNFWSIRLIPDFGAPKTALWVLGGPLIVISRAKVHAPHFGVAVAMRVSSDMTRLA